MTHDLRKGYKPSVQMTLCLNSRELEAEVAGLRQHPHNMTDAMHYIFTYIYPDKKTKSSFTRAAKLDGFSIQALPYVQYISSIEDALDTNEYIYVEYVPNRDKNKSGYLLQRPGPAFEIEDNNDTSDKKSPQLKG